MIDLNDLNDLQICEECGHVFMPTNEQIKGYVKIKFCKICEAKKC